MLDSVSTVAPQPLTWLSCSVPQREEVGSKLSLQFLSIPSSHPKVETRGAFIENLAIKQGQKDDFHTVYPGDKRKGEGNVASSIAGGDIAALRDGHPEGVCERGSFDSCLLEITAAFQGKWAKGRRGHGLSRVETRMGAAQAAKSDLEA